MKRCAHHETMHNAVRSHMHATPSALTDEAGGDGAHSRDPEKLRLPLAQQPEPDKPDDHQYAHHKLLGVARRRQQGGVRQTSAEISGRGRW